LQWLAEFGTLPTVKSGGRAASVGVAWVLVGAAFLLSTTTAWAQTITLPAALYRKQPVRSPELLPDWINHDDCIADDVLSFPTVLNGFLGYTLEVWAGADDCTTVSARFPGGECWRVFTAQATESNFNVQIPARSVAAGFFAPDTPQNSSPSFETCSAATGHQPLSYYFMLISTGTSIVGKPAVWTDAGIDLDPPAAPEDVRADPGSGRLSVNWSASADDDLGGYQVFCDAPSSQSSACQTEDSGAANVAPCATASAQETSAVTAALKNGTLHSVSVIAEDEVGNFSDPSGVACATPVASTPVASTSVPKVPPDGCSCRLATHPNRDPFMFGVLPALSALVALRRRRRNEKARSTATHGSASSSTESRT
jgi:MYXO-CTERM domain-containing protein